MNRYNSEEDQAKKRDKDKRTKRQNKKNKIITAKRK